MSKRARRRADKARMKARARRAYERLWRRPGDAPDWYDPKSHEKLADHMAACSCWACGNPRKYFKERTLQEQKFYCDEVDDEREEDAGGS